jgi:phytoene dehydrogenase-like protein
LIAFSPSDDKEIRALCRAIKLYASFIRTTGKNPFRMAAKAAGMLGAIPLLKKYGSLNLSEYAARFRDPLIRSAWSGLFGYPDFACTNLFFFLAAMQIRGIGFPQGGSLAFARAIERTFLHLNGTIGYR